MKRKASLARLRRQGPSAHFCSVVGGGLGDNRIPGWPPTETEMVGLYFSERGIALDRALVAAGSRDGRPQEQKWSVSFSERGSFRGIGGGGAGRGDPTFFWCRICRLFQTMAWDTQLVWRCRVGSGVCSGIRVLGRDGHGEARSAHRQLHREGRAVRPADPDAPCATGPRGLSPGRGDDEVEQSPLHVQGHAVRMAAFKAHCVFGFWKGR
jgi:hypothetical protein